MKKQIKSFKISITTQSGAKYSFIKELPEALDFNDVTMATNAVADEVESSLAIGKWWKFPSGARVWSKYFESFYVEAIEEQPKLKAV